jgi:hypothetical protein
MLSLPELEWSVHQIKGQDIADGLSDQVLANLGRAMTMAKGTVPKEAWDGSVIGDMAPITDTSKQTTSSKPTAPSTPGNLTPGTVARNKSQQVPAGQDPARPKRNTKKRSYGDSSFEGYGEGFPDDEMGVNSGYSSGGADDSRVQKRRKKVGIGSPLLTAPSDILQNPGGAQPQFPNSSMHQQSYGPGMVGV